MIGRLASVVIDCPDPPTLARFYSELLGLPITQADDDWIDISDGATRRLSFQLAPGHQPPQWPDPGFPQQIHLDVKVDNVEDAERQVLALGAKPLDTDNDESGFRVYADPAGHPFCLIFD